ncbi:MAG: alpha-ketoacid dehydrogenase subunit beta [Clostridiales Family XIII bacterium]|jgi:pyruvate dehydrogenase E1 component beta subunit|nr:alpha-ketoacid dehydrogenase subunit beta [Clostridiales Family XIII bacterium]
MAVTTYLNALNDAMRIELERDPLFYIAGEDVGRFGGPHLVTHGLWKEFGGERIRDMPISETAILGHAVGAAAAGLHPCVEIMYVDFMAVCMDELVNQAAKMHYMFGGKVSVPMVVRTLGGAGMQASAQHSQSWESLFTHVPGLKVVSPSTPMDAKGLFLSSVRDPNPVVFLEHKMLYGFSGECPDGDFTVPIGKADVVKEGTDITIICWSYMRYVGIQAGKLLQEKGVSAEVIDLRSLSPVDWETVLASVRKTGRALIVHEEVKTSGFGGEISARIMEGAFDSLKSPVVRVAAPDTPVPFNGNLEAEFLPNEKIVTDKAVQMF